jgi:superfamily I DNA/RNA helicase
VSKYLEAFKPVQLRYNSRAAGVSPNFPVINFGVSKGMGFDRVLIFPTADMLHWLKDNNSTLSDPTRAKFYVAITRARHSVGIVYDYKPGEVIPNFTAYE